MRRRLPNLLTALSLLLCVALCVLWVRSYTCGDSLTWRRAPRQVDIMSDRGIVMVGWGQIVSEYAAPEGWQVSFWPFARESDTIRFAGRLPGGPSGFAFERVRRDGGAELFHSTSVVFPWWSAGLPSLAIATLCVAVTLRGRHAAARRLAGACGTCGYDLRATPGRCPECGTAPVKTPA